MAFVGLRDPKFFVPESRANEVKAWSEGLPDGASLFKVRGKFWTDEAYGRPITIVSQEIGPNIALLLEHLSADSSTADGPWRVEAGAAAALPGEEHTLEELSAAAQRGQLQEFTKLQHVPTGCWMAVWLARCWQEFVGAKASSSNGMASQSVQPELLHSMAGGRQTAGHAPMQAEHSQATQSAWKDPGQHLDWNMTQQPMQKIAALQPHLDAMDAQSTQPLLKPVLQSAMDVSQQPLSKISAIQLRSDPMDGQASSPLRNLAAGRMGLAQPAHMPSVQSAKSLAAEGVQGVEFPNFNALQPVERLRLRVWLQLGIQHDAISFSSLPACPSWLANGKKEPPMPQQPSQPPVDLQNHLENQLQNQLQLQDRMLPQNIRQSQGLSPQASSESPHSGRLSQSAETDGLLLQYAAQIQRQKSAQQGLMSQDASAAFPTMGIQSWPEPQSQPRAASSQPGILQQQALLELQRRQSQQSLR